MSDILFTESAVFEKRTKATLAWLLKSFDVNDKKHGSSAYYTQLWKPWGWAPAYPETTGYIIPTLLDYHRHYSDIKLQEYAIAAADWICSLQMRDGGLPGGYANSGKPSVFNTGQMLIGLLSAYELTNDDKYIKVIRQAVDWLITNLNNDGSWTIGAYVNGFTPSYYTRVIWPILWANIHLKDQKVNDKIQTALKYYTEKITPKKSIEDWAFRKNQKAFTHTIAYTIRGLYESSLILNDSELNKTSIMLADKVMRMREIKGKLAGWYDENWKGNYLFTCITGNCQIAILLCKIYQQTKDIRYLNTALKSFGDVVEFQNLTPNQNKYGAIPGSNPFFGRYLALRYPNWAAKFYLDAYKLLYDETHKLVL